MMVKISNSTILECDDVLKLRIHERSNVERLNLVVLVTKIGNKDWKNWFISNGNGISQISEIVPFGKIKKFQNFIIWKILKIL